MYRNAMWEWFDHWLLGIGCSLMAAGVIALTSQSDPFLLAVCFVMGLFLPVASLVIRLVMRIPEAPEGE